MKVIQYLFLAITAMLNQSLLADQFELPVSNHNNANPFVQIHGLQGFSGINALGSGELSTQLRLRIDNEFFNKVTSNERVMLDFERTTLSLNMAYGLNELWAVGIDIPYMINSGGILDGLIENWHDLFGLAQGGRDNAPRDEFLISYVSEDQSLLVDGRDQGIGDISLYAEKSVLNTAAYQLGFRTQLKLPTGDEKQLFGSGGYALSLHLNSVAKLSTKLAAFAGAGLSYLAQGDILESQQNNTWLQWQHLVWLISSDPGFCCQHKLI